jgi:hypothetical protein
VAKRPVELDTRRFEKAGDATAFFRAMLNRYEIGSRVSEEDALDLAALLKLHSEYAEKVGAGISHFEVRRPPEEGFQSLSKQCFWVVRMDGSVIDFSYKSCLEKKPASIV